MVLALSEEECRFGARLSSTDYPSTGDHFQSDVELISLKSFDEHVRLRFGGLVMAKSVKVSPLLTTLPSH
jgi:hypothetical protein